MNERNYPKIGYLDGLRFQRAILSGCEELIRHEKELNELNVFPIPDKDTGSNLKRTLTPLIENFPISESRLSMISRKMADLAVRSALGYSGIIFSQFFSGFADAIAAHDRIYPRDLREATSFSVRSATQSIENPTEGTVLSVMKEWAEEISLICLETKDFAQILEHSSKRAVTALENTPEQLDVLKKNNVVDAGGKAFVYFLQGILVYLKTGKLAKISSGVTPLQEIKASEEGTAPYCVECCVHADNLDRMELIAKLGEIGQDLIFYGATNFSKFHINTHDPEKVLTQAGRFGKVTATKIIPFSAAPEDKDKKPFCLVTDSTCDLSEDSIENNDIYFVPVKVQVGDRMYTDRLDLIPEEFYRIFETSPTLPKTSQPALMDFKRVYQHLLAHYRSIISIHLSRALSGTFQTAVQAAQGTAPERITLLDGKNLTVGLGLVVLEGIAAINQGKKMEEVAQQLECASINTEIFIGLPTLKYLVKGGRVTKAKGLIANILNINPILSIGPEGKLVPVSKARGEKNIEQKIFDLTEQRVQKATGGFAIAVAHTNAPDIGTRISKRVKKAFGQEAVMVMNASPVLGAHAGPGAFGLAIKKNVVHTLPSSEDTTNT